MFTGSFNENWHAISELIRSLIAFHHTFFLSSLSLYKVDSDDEGLLEDEELYVKELVKTQPQGTSKIPKFLSSALKGLPER